MNVHFKTLGCRLNEAETESWAQQLKCDGHTIVDHSEKADLIVLNSCAVTEEAARKSRRLIRRIHRENPRAKMVLSGCYATLNQQEAAETLGVDLVVSNADKSRLVELTNRELALETMPALASEPGEVTLFSRGRQRAFIKVQDGCRYRCAYCIVTIARGAETSRPISEIVNEINALQRQGVKEIVLTGVHLGGYGSDQGIHLEQMIEAVLTDTSIPRIRLGSLEPWDLSATFFKLFENPRMMPHLHLPLQSGSDSVLKRMARHCATIDFTKIAKRARTVKTEFNITTDVIVGFPGETQEEWDSTLNYVRRIGFGHMHIFSYSRREGTKAAAMHGQLSTSDKKQRSKQLHKLAESMRLKTYRRFLDCTLPILWESRTGIRKSGRAKVFGYTPNYMRVAVQVEKPEELENQIKPARLKSIASSGDHLIAELVGL